MENIRLVDNIESFPIKLQRVVMGCDFAVSGNVGALTILVIQFGGRMSRGIIISSIYSGKRDCRIMNRYRRLTF